MDKQLKVYLAGPDIFRKNPDEHFLKIKDLCTQYKLTGLIPYDNKLQKSDSIYAYNTLLLSNCDVVVANITPFRGASIDPGTAFEIGYAKSIGKPIVAYTDHYDTEYKDRITSQLLNMSEDFPYIENFGLYDNLMIAHACDFICPTLKLALFNVVSLYSFLLD